MWMGGVGGGRVRTAGCPCYGEWWRVTNVAREVLLADAANLHPIKHDGAGEGRSAMPNDRNHERAHGPVRALPADPRSERADGFASGRSGL